MALSYEIVHSHSVGNHQHICVCTVEFVLPTCDRILWSCAASLRVWLNTSIITCSDVAMIIHEHIACKSPTMSCDSHNDIPRCIYSEHICGTRTCTCRCVQRSLSYQRFATTSFQLLYRRSQKSWCSLFGSGNIYSCGLISSYWGVSQREHGIVAYGHIWLGPFTCVYFMQVWLCVFRLLIACGMLFTVSWAKEERLSVVSMRHGLPELSDEIRHCSAWGLTWVYIFPHPSALQFLFNWLSLLCLP